MLQLPDSDPPSRTSQAVAAIRAEILRPHSPGGDPEAQAKLCAGMQASQRSWLRTHLAARTRFFDQQVLSAIRRGVRQIVILGAGYDGRALRFPSPGVRYFELDHPATQNDKRRRLDAIRPEVAWLTLAPVDFRRNEAGAVLSAHGHDAGQASLFLCEGLLVYLDEATIAGLLSDLRSRANAESRLAASLAVHAEGMDSQALLDWANARRRTAATEPWRTVLPAAAHCELLHRNG